MGFGDAFEQEVGPYEVMRFGRVIPAMILPTREGSDPQNPEVDFEVATALASYLVENGADGLVINGTTGESPSVSDEELVGLLDHIDGAGITVPILAGVGNADPKKSIETIKKVETLTDGLLVVSPYYNRPSQAGIEDYFKRIAGETDKPIIMYDIQPRTGREIALETILRLAEVENIVGVKDAHGDDGKTMDVFKNTEPDFNLYSGDDSRNRDILLLTGGESGAISVHAHWTGNVLQAMYEAYDAGDTNRVFEIDGMLGPSATYESMDGKHGRPEAPNPQPTRVMMRYLGGLGRLGFDVGTGRAPMHIDNPSAPDLEDAVSAYAHTVWDNLGHNSERLDIQL